MPYIKIIFTIIICFIVFNVLMTPVFAEAKWTNPTNKLQITIPGLKLTDPAPCPSPNQDKMCVPWIGQYITAIYKYALGTVGILAVIVMMFGGILWVTAGGSQERVGSAKAWIGASLTGLILSLGSYTLLYKINPELTEFKPIQMAEVSGIGCCDKPKTGEGTGCKMLSENKCENGYWYKEGWSCNDEKTECTNLLSEGPTGTIYKWECLPRFISCEEGTSPPTITYERTTCQKKLGSAPECSDSLYPQSICCGLSPNGVTGEW